MRAFGISNNASLFLLAVVASAGITLTGLGLKEQLIFAAAILVGILYLMNSQKVFWCFIALIPILPPYLAYKAGGAPFVNGFRIMLLIFIFDQLVLKRRLSYLIRAIRNDKFKIMVIVYSMGIIISGLIRASMGDFSGNIVSSTAIIVEKVLFYYLVLMNINIEIEKAGSKEVFLSKFLHIICTVAFILSCFGIAEYLLQFNVFSLLDVSNYEGLKYHAFIRSDQLRISSSFAHTLGYSMYLLLMIPVAFYQIKATAERSKKQRNFYILLTLLLVLNLFMTLSRSAIIALIVAATAYLLFTTIKSKLKFLIAVIYFAIPIVLLSLSPIGKDIPGLSTVGSNINALSDAMLGTNKVENFGNNEEPFSYRNALIKYAFSQHGNEDVWGKGIGFIENEPLKFYLPKLNRYALTESRSIDNYYALVKLEQGWVGLAATAFLFVTVLFTLIRYRKNNLLNMMILLSFAAYFSELFMVADLDTIKYFWMLLAVFSAFHAYRKNEEARS